MTLFSERNSAIYGRLPFPLKIALSLWADAVRSLGPTGGFRAMTRRYDLRTTIVVSGCPRSGTTWVAEVLSTIPGSGLLYEPLYLRSNPILKEIGFRWQTHMDPADHQPAARRFLRFALEGKVLNPGTLSRIRPDSVSGTKIWIVKFVRANMLLGWLARQFPITPPLVLIRHPCAVVASQLRMGAWNHVTAPAECPEFFDRFPQFAPVRDRVRHLDEILAVQWCMEYYAILQTPPPQPWFLLPYENLVLDPGSCFSAIFAHFGHEVPPLANRMIHRDSSTTVDDGLSVGNQRLDSWKRYLEPVQIDRILNICDAFGIDAYSEDGRPARDITTAPGRGRHHVQEGGSWH